MKKIESIQVLRVFLILGIMFFHFTIKFSDFFGIQTINFPMLSEWGIIGDNCYFMISGLFIMRWKGNNFKFKDYFKNKLIRIWPLYVICLTIIFIIVNTIGLQGRQTNFIDYFLNVFFINGFIDTNYVDGAHWYLTYLITFYIIIGLILKFSKGMLQKNFLRDDNLCLVAYSIVRYLIYVLSFFIAKFSRIYLLVGGFFADSLIIGICINKIVQKDYNKKTIILLVMSFLAVFILQGVLCGISMAVFAVILYFCMIEKIEFKSKFLTKIGDFSYIIFLLHQNIGYIIILSFYNMFNRFDISFVFIAIAFIVTISYFLDIIYKKAVIKFKEFRRRNIND